MVKALMREFLRLTDIVQYIEYIFSTTFDKVYNYSAVPKIKRTKDFESYDVHANVFIPKTVEELDSEEIRMLCDELLEIIVGSLVSMPQSIRYLLVLIKDYIKESVIFY
jgi:hypothetical protein